MEKKTPKYKKFFDKNVMMCNCVYLIFYRYFPFISILIYILNCVREYCGFSTNRISGVRTVNRRRIFKNNLNSLHKFWELHKTI